MGWCKTFIVRERDRNNRTSANKRGEGSKFLFFCDNVIIEFPLVTLSTEDNTKPLHKFQSGFKRTIDLNEKQLKASAQALNNIYIT